MNFSPIPRLIAMIESEEDCFPQVIHSIAQNKFLEPFLEQAESSIKSTDKKIEQVCSQKYNEFIQVSSAFLRLRDQSTSLMHESAEINSQIQMIGNKLINVTNESISSNHNQKMCCQIKSDLMMCLPVFKLLEKIQNHLNEAKYNETMKSVRELESSYLPSLAKFKFHKLISNFLLDIRRQIKIEMKRDLNNYLELIRYQSSKFGSDLLNSVERRRNPSMGDTKVLTKALNQFELMMNSNPKDFLNLIPLHRCISLYSLLDNMEEVENYYINQRRQQILLTFETLNKKIMNLGQSVASNDNFFDDIAGFFMIEDKIAESTMFSQKSYLFDLWNLAEQELVLLIDARLSNCSTPEVLLRFKTSLVHFYYAMKKFDLLFSPLSSLLESLFKQYIVSLKLEIDKRIDAVHSKSGYSKLVVHSKSDYQSCLSKYPNIPNQQLTFPNHLPFSEVSLTICDQITIFTQKAFGFLSHSMCTTTNIDSNIRVNTGELLSTMIKSRFLNPLEKMCTKTNCVNEMAQICVDINYLLAFSDYLQGTISQMTLTDRRSDYVGEIISQHDQQQMIDSSLGFVKNYCRANVKKIFMINEFDWMNEEEVASNDLEIHILPLLKETINSFAHLPAVMSHEICLYLFEVVFDCFETLIVHTDIKMISYNSLLQFSSNLKAIEDFARSEPVHGLQPSAILFFSDPIRQGIDILVNWDWVEFLESRQNSSNAYSRVDTDMLILIVEKLLAADKKKSMFAFKKSDRDRRKMLESLIKQLRDIKK